MGLYLHAGKHKHRINLQNTKIHAQSEIRTHDPSVPENEESSCLRLPGRRNWPNAGDTYPERGAIIKSTFDKLNKDDS
jgi:hypothetical protein